MINTKFICFQVADRVENTKTIEAIARLYDSLDSPLALDYENLKIYELREHVWNSNILNIEIGHLSNLNAGEIRYFITGVELGETKLTITSGNGEKTVSSPAYPIQVSLLSIQTSHLFIVTAQIISHNTKATLFGLRRYSSNSSTNRFIHHFINVLVIFGRTFKKLIRIDFSHYSFTFLWSNYVYSNFQITFGS